MSSLLIQIFTDKWETFGKLNGEDPPIAISDYSSGEKELYVVFCCRNFANIYKVKGKTEEKINNYVAISRCGSLKPVKKLDTDNPCYDQSIKMSEKSKPVSIAFTYLS